MLTYSFANRGNVPLYDYLYQCIKSDILHGNLKAEEKLPSKRSLAQHLKVSVITVENAYAQLIVEGYIYAIQKRGYYVSALEESIPPTFKKKAMPAKLTEPQPQRQWFFDLKSNSISAAHFPFSIWSKLMREVLSEQDTKLLKATPYNGVDKLREEIAEYLYHFRGMSVSADQIIVGAGTEYLYNLLIQLLGRDHIYAVENPGYQKIAKIYKSNDVSCRYIDMDEYGLSAAKLSDSNASVVHLSPSHHYPTGIVMPIGRRQELLSWANTQKNRYIIEDDYDSEFRFAGRPIQTLQSIDENHRVIYINTFSKSIAPSIRISYMVLPPGLVPVYREKLGFYSCTVPSFEQYALAKFIAGGYFEKHINRMKKFYRTQRDHVIKAIEESRFHDIVEIREEDAGLHFLLKVDTDRSDREIVQAAAGADIKISCLSEYLHTPDERFDHTILINYSGIDSSKLPEAMERLSKILLPDSEC
ncbi:MAG: PLP-dependent aminotransferase family protein [Lachnospiraceae bacterium]|nr:PLP-dependent aminotransferase family protein [Lachnospiraceae bacterium]